MENSTHNFELKVDFRCNTKVADMEITDSGFHCQNCSRAIVDFRQMSDGEIAQVHAASPEKICGVYRRDQVYRSKPSTQPYRGVKLWKPVSMAMIGILSASASLHAQQATNYKGRCPVPVEQTIVATPEEEPIDESRQPDQSQYKKVVDAETGDPLVGVNILIEGTSYGTATDFEGNFKLPEVTKPDDDIVISCIGYQSLIVSASKVEDVVKLEARDHENMMIVGLIVYVGPDKKTPSQVKGWRRVKNFFRTGHL